MHIQRSTKPLDECTFVILGATGNLAQRKLIPALYNLFASGALTRCTIIGVALAPTTVELIFDRARQFIQHVDETVWQKLIQASHYFSMDFHDESAYDVLHDAIKALEQKHALKGNRLFYLATMPHHFAKITQCLAASGIVEKHHQGAVPNKGTWARVVYEKPFGDSLRSARVINRAIAKVFDEKQVFRIDHWLGKELVANIALSRFTNRVFEPLWNKDHIESVQIILNESSGVSGRGAFYDAYGALKDVMQNHVMQILALVAMEVPEHFTAEYLRDVKAQVLKKVKVEAAVLGQYEGYLQEKDVKQDSQTDTFAALKVTINNRRWKGVPFYLKTGRHMKTHDASVHIKFKMVKCLLDFCPMDSNYLTINIQPNEGFYLELNVKEPGVFNHVVTGSMNMAHRSQFGPNTPEAYEVLLADVIRGDHFAFVRADEIDSAWRIIESVKKLNSPLHTYERGSTGPAALKDLDPDIRWRA